MTVKKIFLFRGLYYRVAINFLLIYTGFVLKKI